MTIGRPLDFDPDIALESAMQLFWRKGYGSSSLQGLLAAMGLSKSSFYQTFKSKHALFLRCIERYRQMLTRNMIAQLEKTESGKAFISNLFHSVTLETVGIDARRGCLLMNTASEFAQTDPEISRLVNDSIDSFTKVFELAVEKAQHQGDIPSNRDLHTLATYLVSSMSGLRNMVKAGADRESVKRIADTVLSALK